MSLLSHLQKIPDPRSRWRRECPLYGLLAILILAAAYGDRSLRRMWQWGQQRAFLLMNFFLLGLWANARFPALGTFWDLLSKLPAGEIERALSGWGGTEREYAVEGKVLRGSKWRGEEALCVVIMVGHRLRQVIVQEGVEEGDELAAALRLLEEDLEGKVVSANAGLLKAPYVQKVVEKEEVYRLVKENQPVLRQAIGKWLLLRCPEGTKSLPGWEEVEKGHGRLERRRLWIVSCEADREAYLQELGWPGVQ